MIVSYNNCIDVLCLKTLQKYKIIQIWREEKNANIVNVCTNSGILPSNNDIYTLCNVNCSFVFVRIYNFAASSLKPSPSISDRQMNLINNVYQLTNLNKYEPANPIHSFAEGLVHDGHGKCSSYQRCRSQ